MGTNFWRIKKLGDKTMKLEEAIELVLNEAESSALGDNSQNVLSAIEVVQAFYEEHGHHFANFSLDNFEKVF